MFSLKGHEEEEEEEEEEGSIEEDDNKEKSEDKFSSTSNINDHKITSYGTVVESSFDTYAVERKIPVSHQVLL